MMYVVHSFIIISKIYALLVCSFRILQSRSAGSIGPFGRLSLVGVRYSCPVVFYSTTDAKIFDFSAEEELHHILLALMSLR